jgi:hypothetical protein
MAILKFLIKQVLCIANIGPRTIGDVKRIPRKKVGVVRPGSKLIVSGNEIHIVKHVGNHIHPPCFPPENPKEIVLESD